ncbi:MAG: fatty acid desaturase family protein [bacterium]
MTNQKIIFPFKNKPEFINELRIKVNAYFEDNKISKYGNPGMVVKTIFMFALYLVPYFLMITGVVRNPVTMLFLWLIMGTGMAGIGLSVMHDANHKVYSKNQKVNKVLFYSLNFLSGFFQTWQHQHNTLHHGYTNIDGHDEDINPGKILRLSPSKPKYSFHKYQHFYGWFVYGLMTLTWSTNKDFKQLYRYHREGVTLNTKRSFRSLLTELIISKIFFYGYLLVIPLLLLPLPWWLVIVYYLSMHLVCGFILGIIFQTAHVMPTSRYPLPDKKGNMENNWAIHQLLTTTDYSPNARAFSWFVGGLNYQVEHHLFLNICHVHYRKIAPIVRETAEKHGLPYHVQPTFFKALHEHYKMLKLLGRQSAIKTGKEQQMVRGYKSA